MACNAPIRVATAEVHYNSKFKFGEAYRRIYVRKSSFTAPLARRRKSKFPTIYPTINLPKYSYPLNIQQQNLRHRTDNSRGQGEGGGGGGGVKQIFARDYAVVKTQKC